MLHKMYWDDIKDNFVFGTQKLNTNGYGIDNTTHTLEFKTACGDNQYVIEFLDSKDVEEFYSIAKRFYKYCRGGNLL